MFAILFPLPLRLYITVVLIFSQHSLFLPICCFLFVLTSSTVILGHLLIFTSGALTSELGGSGLRFFTTGCYGRKFGFSINTFGSFIPLGPVRFPREVYSNLLPEWYRSGYKHPGTEDT